MFALMAGMAVAVLCAPIAWAQAPAAPNSDGLASGQLHMEADEIVRDDKAKRTTASGDIEVRFNNRTLRADRLVYEDATGVIRAFGNITVINADGSVEFTDELILDDELQAGVALGFFVRLPQNVKIAAASAAHLNSDIDEMNKAIYTPCEVCVDDGGSKTPTWSISADRVIRDKKRRTISYRHARFHLFGMPVMYLPVFWHADPEAQRSSGFLVPTAGISDRRGVSYEQPYYWAFSRSADLTISPQFNSNVNTFVNLRTRLAFYSGVLDLRLGYTRDRDFDGRGNEFGESTDRSYILGRGAFRIDEKWKWGFTVDRTSDDLIFDKYEVSDVYDGRGPYIADDRRLISQLYTIRQTPLSYVSVAAISIQGLRPDDIDRTFPTIAPLTESRFEPKRRIAGGRLRLQGSSVGLYREQSLTNPEQRLPGLDSRRLTSQADWRRPFTMSGGLRVETFVNLRADVYMLDDVLSGTGSNVDDRQMVRGLATAGAHVTYPLFRRLGDNASAIIEPIVQVVASPNAKQIVIGKDADGTSVFLNEDSVAFEFDESTLFRANKFPGYDVYEDGVRVNVAGRATVLWDDGRRAHFLVGRSFRSQENPVFSPRSGLRRTASDWIISADAQPLQGLSMFARVRLDADTLDIHRLEAGANVSNRFGSGFVRYLTDDFDINGARRENLDLGGELNLGARLGLTAYGSRDMTRDAWVIRDLGVFYQDNCLRVDVIYRREDVIIGRLLPSESVSVRLTLATLGGAFQSR